ncbi:glycosyltransferase involved in cell wall biosynthesis [Prosthecobacter fusiformis]|uniref:Glycosyltransferase involved in cell wall biosynthesis n=1 Tax=Prosthecobacter fusiformis TaxID=48464 RepID=A0A4R7S499_9BACT|nr:glycosyltransferase family 1 protein [Prosthecobacter fusiformis]TDU73171.1 glycosyltransferase involved in cell wall biosynthesis [Prosthecobacter fusiformis]
MRFLLITDTFPPDINGVARTLATLASGLESRGHQVEIVTTLEAAPEAEESLKRHIVMAMPLPGYPGLRMGFTTTWQMQALYEEFRPDALYVATETPLGIASIRAAKKMGIPTVSGFHTNFQTYLEDYSLPGLEAVAQGLLRSIHNQTARTLTPSIDTAAMLEKWGIHNVGVLGRGVDTDLFTPARRDPALRQTWGADESTPVAIYVGRVAAEKNLDLLTRAFSAFREVHPQAPCVVVGDGPKLKNLQTDHPEFYYSGARTGNELAAHYASADVFLFPSITETFGNVVLEAMSSGLLTVAFDYAAPRLLIHPGENGLLAAFNDEPDFLEKTRSAATAWNDQIQRTAAREAAHHLGWQRVIEQFESELLQVIGTTPQHPA